MNSYDDGDDYTTVTHAWSCDDFIDYYSTPRCVALGRWRCLMSSLPYSLPCLLGWLDPPWFSLSSSHTVPMCWWFKPHLSLPLYGNLLTPRLRYDTMIHPPPLISTPTPSAMTR